uniref:Uncharacterized protein n=1 Tax=Anguilla anguilla TaxID=7936 RepID=A0A0E9WRD5_ANGAN
MWWTEHSAAVVILENCNMRLGMQKEVRHGNTHLTPRNPGDSVGRPRQQSGRRYSLTSRPARAINRRASSSCSPAHRLTGRSVRTWPRELGSGGRWCSSPLWEALRRFCHNPPAGNRGPTQSLGVPGALQCVPQFSP